jgi:hypothetical protein
MLAIGSDLAIALKLLVSMFFLALLLVVVERGGAASTS